MLDYRNILRVGSDPTKSMRTMELELRSSHHTIRKVLDAAGKAGCKNRHPSPICMQFGHHPAGVSAPLSRSEAPMPYNWFSTAIL